MTERTEQQEDFIGFDGLSAESIIHQDCQNLGAEPKWGKQLIDILKVFESAFKRRNINDDEAQQLAAEAVAALANYQGGRTLYIPTGERFKSAMRDIEIFNFFNGNNIEQLCKKYKLTEQRIYQILKEQRKNHIRKKQPDLF